MQITKNPLVQLLFVYFLWIATNVFSSSLIYLYFKNAGLSEFELLSSFVFAFTSTLIVTLILNRKKINFRDLMCFAVILMAIAYTLLFFLSPSKELLVVYNLLLGATFFVFWVPFNILYFELSKGKEAQLGSIYFSMAPFLNLLLPFLSGVLVEALSFGMLFLISSILYLSLAIVTTFTIKNREIMYDLEECKKELKGFKTLILLEGIYSGGFVTAATVVSLFYFTKPLDLGAFLSVTTVFSIIASLIVSKISDKSRKRKNYITIFGFGAGIVLMIGTFADSAFVWFGVMSLRNFFSALFLPFTTAILIDNERNTEKSMVGRETVLNLGRIIGAGVVLLSWVMYSNIHFSLMIIGLSILGYPLIIELKKKNIKVY